MGPLKQRTITVNADITTVLNASRQAIAQCGWKVSHIDSFSIKASIGISICSWGETVFVQVKEIGGVTYLNIQSKSVCALVDLGKNQENINKFLKNLSRYPLSFT